MMNYKSILIPSLLWACCIANAQIYTSKTAAVHFFSTTPMENIEATSTTAVSAINTQTGMVSIKLTVKSFKFKSDLMEEHFNENYMESEKYPNSEFKGKITNLSDVDFTKDGEYSVKVTGDLTMHGVTKARTIDAKLVIKGKQIVGTSKFAVALADHNIERPKIVWEKIAESIDVDVKFEYEPYAKK